MELVDAVGPSEFEVIGKRTIKFKPIPSLEPGEKLVYGVVCKALKEGIAINTAAMMWDQFRQQIVDKEGTFIYK